MANESLQKKLERVRPPRVNITYEVETGDESQMKELPFVMGVLGDFSAQSKQPLARLKDRKFTEVTPDNFDDVLAGMKPHLSLPVDNKLSDEGGGFTVELDFERLDDFAPERVARQVEPVARLLELRGQLANLRGKLQGNDQLEEILQETLNDAEKLGRLKAELASEKSADESGDSDDGGNDG